MTGITVDVLDRIHRLLRLSRHVPWDLWELDLLVRTTHLGGGAVNGPALVALRDAAQLQAASTCPPRRWPPGSVICPGRAVPTPPTPPGRRCRPTPRCSPTPPCSTRPTPPSRRRAAAPSPPITTRPCWRRCR
ncbi:hypothetical protein BZL30_0871 [Mycobacterium kansasii]|uniref:Uncharacterized protein n=1 Tax=Mycobacterium kansasii TaxID=1768 RepID=A0A1V3XR93_MYCKA|nr:hypothetical protein BZL30_0871 [Mycobacterium kansasii]